MPLKKAAKKGTVGVNKMAVKNVDEKQTSFSPVTYETKDILSSIALLHSPEHETLTRALFMLSKYSDERDYNTIFLYESKIMPALLRLVRHSDIVISRFSLKLIGQIVSVASDATAELATKKETNVKEIIVLFLTSSDHFVKEFCSQILAKIASNIKGLPSDLLRSGIVGPIFNSLVTLKDLDVYKYLLELTYTIVCVPEASDVLPKAPDFNISTLVCFLGSVCEEIQSSVIDILTVVSGWKNGDIQQAFCSCNLLQTLLTAIMDNKNEKFHLKLFSIVQNCVESPTMAHALIQMEQFLQFCEWAKRCRNSLILSTAAVFATLCGYANLLQILFDFAVEDTVLSLFRTDDEWVFLKTCEAISNLCTHRYCCRKMVTPAVMQCLLNMLHKSVDAVPFHEAAIHTIDNFMKRDNRALNLLIQCHGANTIIQAIAKGPTHYTERGFSNLLEILYMLTANVETRKQLINRSIYEILLNLFVGESAELSRSSLAIMKQYVDESECRQYLLEFNGAELILNKIAQTDDDQLFKATLVFLERIVVYKSVGVAFLHAKLTQRLKELSKDLRLRFPIIHTIETLMLDFYLPLKFHQLGRLDVCDRLRNRFYVLKGPCTFIKDFPFIDILESMQMSSRATIYIVDYSANRSALMLKPMKQSVTSTMRKLRKASKQKLSSKRSSTSSIKSSTKGKKRSGSSISLSSRSTVLYLNERVQPAINFGGISSDPYLIEYLKELRKKLFRNEKGPMCFHHQVKTLAKFVHGKLSGAFALNNDDDSCLHLHIAALREKLGTNVIPIGYLRCGGYCEKALLFKSLADNVGLPVTLEKSPDCLRYWNQVPLLSASPYSKSSNENVKLTFLTYCVVDLINNIGDLMLVGSLEANKYCGRCYNNAEMKNHSTLCF